ncbi:MAG: hypothetical protein DRJ07_09685 [Bacteroidetes bacterium]|nr:MAG: hypothetical protein DRJ07_09685 [Bacteroidota bacterium]
MKKTIIKVNSMNFDKELKLTHSKSNAQWWRKGLIWGFIFTFGIISFSCDSDSDDEGFSDEYYVKYEVSSTAIHVGGKLNVILNSETSEDMAITINKRQKWEVVIGPVRKGFDSKLKVSSVGTDDWLRLYTNIYVSKNDSPFALKMSDGSDEVRQSVEINYTIDY